jgi:hypothetical protein
MIFELAPNLPFSARTLKKLTQQKFRILQQQYGKSPRRYGRKFASLHDCFDITLRENFIHGIILTPQISPSCWHAI